MDRLLVLVAIVSATVSITGCRTISRAPGPRYRLAPVGYRAPTKPESEIMPVAATTDESLEESRRATDTPGVGRVVFVDRRPECEKQFRAWGLIPEYWKVGRGFVPLENFMRDWYGFELVQDSLKAEFEEMPEEFDERFVSVTVDLNSFRAVINTKSVLKRRYEAGEREMPSSPGDRVEVAKGVVLEYEREEKDDDEWKPRDQRTDESKDWVGVVGGAIWHMATTSSRIRTVRGGNIPIGIPGSLEDARYPSGVSCRIEALVILDRNDGGQDFVPITIFERWSQPEMTTAEMERELPNIVRRAFERFPAEVIRRVSEAEDEGTRVASKKLPKARATSLKGL